MGTTELQSASEIVDEITSLLRDEVIRREIDRRIETAVAAFRRPPGYPVTHARRLDLMGAFAAHIHRHGLRAPRSLTHDQAVAEAIALLEQHPAAGAYGGYRGCLIDVATLGEEGLELTLARIAEAVIARERARYLRWVFETRIDSLAFTQRKRVVALLLERIGDRLPAILAPFGHAWWAECLPALLQVMTDAEDTCREFLGDPPFPAP